MSRRFALLLIAPTVLLLACGGGATITRGPRWACPSPIPKPYGAAGPVKDIVHHTRPITEGGDWDEPIYYDQWEQEYGSLGGPPFPSPTPYSIAGTSYSFGQRVDMGPFHALVTARPGPVIDRVGIAGETQQLYWVDIRWTSHVTAALPIDYIASVHLRAVRLLLQQHDTE